MQDTTVHHKSTPQISTPVLRYYGGKWRLASWILSHFPPHRIYVEPFGGAASVLLRKPPAEIEVYHDLDGEVVNFFRVLREQPGALARAVALTPYARAEYLLAHDSTDDPVERARRFAVRAWQGIGGATVQWRTGWRWRLDGRIVAEWNRLPDVVRVAAERLKEVIIENLPAEAVIGRYDTPETLFYCDPPYLPATRSKWREKGYAHEMGEKEHRALAELLGSVRGMVIISGYDHPLYDEWYRGWRKVCRAARTQNGSVSAECLWLSPRAVERAVLPLLEAMEV